MSLNRRCPEQNRPYKGRVLPPGSILFAFLLRGSNDCLRCAAVIKADRPIRFEIFYKYYYDIP